MSDINIFEAATRGRLRFGSNKGMLTVEDLWDLPLNSKNNASLDGIARAYNRELKSQEEESFVTKPARKDSVLELGFEVVKHIIEVRLAENEAAKKKIDRDKEKKLLMELIAKKEVEELGATDIKDLKKRLAAMG